EKMLVHQMAVLHYGMMRAAARMNEELDAADVIDPKVAAGMFDLNKREAAEAANVRACRLAGAISRLSATYQQGLLTLQRKRTGGKPARHCEAHSPAGECHRRRASRGRGRHGNEGPGGATAGMIELFSGAWVKHSPPTRLRNASAVAASGKQNRIWNGMTSYRLRPRRTGMRRSPWNVSICRFTPKSGQIADMPAGPSRAKSPAAKNVLFDYL